MRYLSEADLHRLELPYPTLTGAIRGAIGCLASGDFAQPIKPYLRYREPQNRIIAMPAFVGGPFDVAGLKWIASFPGNIEKGLPRASSIVIVNDAANGSPIACINGAYLSVMRTAAVSGAVLEEWTKSRDGGRKLSVGMTGFGPIGKDHVRMAKEILGGRIGTFKVFDPRADVELAKQSGVELVSSWQDAYADADLFMTCTVSKDRYVDLPPKRGSLHLNVSLRDYTARTFPEFRGRVLVDDWAEVCRENTDIEHFTRECGLDQAGSVSLAEAFSTEIFSKRWNDDAPIFFCPMGMAVFDMAIAKLVLDESRKRNVGIDLA
jgi:2,3-diaminopropionate biosynthesis protein SbnB